jgi:hypothetical protein
LTGKKNKKLYRGNHLLLTVFLWALPQERVHECFRESLRARVHECFTQSSDTYKKKLFKKKALSQRLMTRPLRACGEQTRQQKNKNI